MNMKKTAKARFIIFIIIHVVLCSYVFLCTKGYAELVNKGAVEYISDLYVDGADFTDIANLGITAFNGAFSMLEFAGCVVSMFVISVILIVPLRLISVRKLTEVSDFELKTTMKVIIAGIVIMLLAGIIFCGINMLIPMLIMTVPPLIFEIFVHWFSLKEKNLKDESEN